MKDVMLHMTIDVDDLVEQINDACTTEDDIFEIITKLESEAQSYELLERLCKHFIAEKEKCEKEADESNT